MRAAAGFGTPNRRNRSMPRPPLFGTTAALCVACMLAQHHASSDSQLHCSSLCYDTIDDECSVC
jgi:hypothetical protein